VERLPPRVPGRLPPVSGGIGLVTSRMWEFVGMRDAQTCVEKKAGRRLRRVVISSLAHAGEHKPSPTRPIILRKGTAQSARFFERGAGLRSWEFGACRGEIVSGSRRFQTPPGVRSLSGGNTRSAGRGTSAVHSQNLTCAFVTQMLGRPREGESSHGSTGRTFLPLDVERKLPG
jgi:hypothetical protein